MATNREAKIKFTAETGEFNDAIRKADSTMTELRSEMKLLDAQMANTGTTAEGLEQKQGILAQQQEQLAAKTQALVGKYEKAVAIWGENSTEAQKLATQVNNARTAEEKLKGQVSKCNAELQEAKAKMDNAERSAHDLADGFDKAEREARELGSSVGDIAAGNIIADFATNAISSLTGLEEATRQYRNEQNKLEAIAQTSGESLDELKGSYSDLFAITADETLASTAVANMSAMGLSTEQTNDLLHAATGIWAQYGDSIPLDGLMESINETAAVGTVTGNLADSLNWASISEDEFNEKLAACSTEQERQQLIIDTLNSEYGSLAGAYAENNQAVMDMNRANEEMMDSQAKLAERIAPLQTIVTSFAADGIGFLADNFKIIAPITIAAATAFGILAVALNFGAIVQGLSGAMGVLNAVMALNPAVLVVAGLVLLTTTFVTLWNNCEAFRNFWLDLWDGLCGAAEKGKEFFAWCGDAIIGKLSSIKNWASETWNSIANTISEKITAAKDAVKNGIDKIKSFFDFEWSLPKLKMPHFSMTGSFSLVPPSVPKISVEWYAKAMNRGMILNSPTIFGMKNGKLLAGGEAGSETVVGTNSLMNMIQTAVSSSRAGNIYATFNIDAKNMTPEEVESIVYRRLSRAQAAMGR